MSCARPTPKGGLSRTLLEILIVALALFAAALLATACRAPGGGWWGPFAQVGAGVIDGEGEARGSGGRSLTSSGETDTLGVVVGVRWVPGAYDVNLAGLGAMLDLRAALEDELERIGELYAEANQEDAPPEAPESPQIDEREPAPIGPGKSASEPSPPAPPAGDPEESNLLTWLTVTGIPALLGLAQIVRVRRRRAAAAEALAEG